jgi:uncharacterized RDD family membrane protein YckC
MSDTQPALMKHTCPFCRRPLLGRTDKILYGHPICKKCYYAFANRRQCAFVIDRVIWQAPLLGILFLVMAIVSATGGKVTQEMADSINLLRWPLFLAFLFKDGFSGYSPGKWLCGVRVIDWKTRQPLGFMASFKRNLPVFIPVVPLVIAYQLQKGKRWGDGWSNSMVIWKKYAASHVFFGTTGTCEACQYDLRGNVSGICPECGTPVSERNRQMLALEQTPAA